MKIEQSAVTMNAGHKLSSEYEVKVDSEISFRSIFDGVSQSEKISANGEADRDARLLMMLEALIARMLELISGKQDTPVTDVLEVLKTDDAALPERSASGPGRVAEMEWKSEFTETFRERESTDFSSTGKIRTADGRMLDLSLIHI